ncbi:HEPN domain-containing protein [Kribbella sp. CA-245084]|uniref:ApeA N-terminal domain 1-containing protein n=1 Tax=Kribbella sp. CA-245084 TaxID=3239940 RepID=UPI003D8C020A
MAGKWRGYWWVPEDTEAALGGTAEVNDEGDIRLELVGGFELRLSTPSRSGRGRTFDGRWRRLPIIHGASGAKKVTLIDSRVARQHGGIGEGSRIDHQDLTSRVLLVGVHLSSTDDPIFDSAQIRLENLAAWAGLGGVDYRFNEDGSESSAHITRPEAQVVEIPEATIRVSTTEGVFALEELRDSVQITGSVKTVLWVTPSDSTTYTGFDRLTESLMDLLTLASGEACGILGERLYYPDTFTGITPDGVSETTPTAGLAEVIREKFYRGSAESPSKDSRTFLFTCRDESFANLVSRWLPLRANAANACEVLFGLQYAPPEIPSVRLLAVAVAAEALHRALYPDTIAMLPRDFERISTQALRSIRDEDDGAWVRNRLRNEPSYRERMLDLAIKPAPEAVEFIIPDRDTWARDLGNARNGLAHSAKAAEARKMYDLESVTEQLLYLVLMAELGLSADVQLRAMQTNSYMGFLARERTRAAEANEGQQATDAG